MREGYGTVQWPDDVLDRLRRYLGIDRGVCPLPGHSGRAYIDTDPDGDDERPWLLCCTGRRRSLGETRAAIAYGQDRLRSNIEIAIWTRRLAFEVDAFAPVEVQMPPLPEDADGALRTAGEGFALLTGLRWADGPRRPVAWSVRFAAAWCGLSAWEARTATTALRMAGVIVETGRVGRVRLYMPGGPGLRLVGGAGDPPPAEPPLSDGLPYRWGEDELVAAVIDVFDAVEVTDEPSAVAPPATPSRCPNRSHAGQGWRLAAGGPWRCGICHPPVVESIVWEAA